MGRRPAVKMAAQVALSKISWATEAREGVDLVDSCFSRARSGVRAEIASQAVAGSATNEVLGASGGLLRSKGLDQRAAARSPVALRLCAARGVPAGTGCRVGFLAQRDISFDATGG